MHMNFVSEGPPLWHQLICIHKVSNPSFQLVFENPGTDTVQPKWCTDS